MHVPQGPHQRQLPSDQSQRQALQIASWNVRGKSLFQVADVLSDQKIYFDILALQEVGAVAQGTVTDYGFWNRNDPRLQLHDELNDYWVVCTDCLNSHLGQAILIDKSYTDGILGTLKGDLHWRSSSPQKWDKDVDPCRPFTAPPTTHHGL